MFAKALGRFLLPNLERDLNKAVSKEMISASKMTDCFLSPSVYGFEKQACASSIGHATSSVQQRAAAPTKYVKVNYKTPAPGLFQ
jgi:hypothetical protein